MDYLQAIKDASMDRTIGVGDREVSLQAMSQFSKSMAPEGRASKCRGLNLCHPFAVGYDVHLNKNQQSLLLAAENQGWICRIDQQDLRVAQNNGGQKMGWNPLKDLVDWFPDQVICWACRHWMISNFKHNMPKALACTSLEELRKIRLHSIGWRVPRRQDYEDDPTTECPVCEEDFEERLDGETREVAQKRTKHIKNYLHEDMKKWDCLKDAGSICIGCYAKVLNIVKSDFHEAIRRELEAGCAISRLRAYLRARRRA